MHLDKIVRGVRKNDRKAQKALYNQYSPLFMAIAMRYLKDLHDAEDVLTEAFLKIFTKIHSFENKGSFEGWMKKIVINECLMALRQRKKQFLYVSIDEIDIEIEPEIISHLSAEELLDVIRELPEGYRTIFNLYEIEGLKHREIAEELDISINTSKSQLIMAKRKIREILKKNLSTNNHERTGSTAG